MGATRCFTRVVVITLSFPKQALLLPNSWCNCVASRSLAEPIGCMQPRVNMTWPPGGVGKKSGADLQFCANPSVGLQEAGMLTRRVFQGVHLGLSRMWSVCVAGSCLSA